MHSVVTVACHAPALDRTVSYTALVPESGTPPFAVLYQLHGMNDDHRAWIEKSNLLRYVDGMPLVVILPSGENSYYVGPWERLIVDDIPAHVARTFRVREGKAAIGGLSMGGYGAIRLGLLYPHRYASIFAHSSRLPQSEEPADNQDVGFVAERVERAAMPALAFDCGVDDHLIADSRRFHARLDALGLAHQYREHPGAHTWDYWDEHVREAIAWQARVLGL
jgi:S-formylglutathione hydrolase FrmB